jgi:NTE family protein
MAKKTLKVLVLGGGAPNLTLMSGALLAIHEKLHKEFDVIYMGGGGAVVGLLYLAPKGLTREDALRNTVNFGISDLIYSMCPINYKMFSKGGPSAEAFRDYWWSLPPVQEAMNQFRMSPEQKLESDWLLFTGAMMSPTDVNYFSKGLCAHVPFIENVVDFAKLQTVSTKCRLSAYCIEEEKVVEFERPIDVHHFRAALSFPFIYPPYRIGDKHYYEGAAVDCLNLIDLMHHHGVADIEEIQIVVFDVLRPYVTQQPRNLWDAYAQSVMISLVANAEKELAMFRHWIKTGHIMYPPAIGTVPHRLAALRAKLDTLSSNVQKLVQPFIVEFSIPAERRPYLLDWSRSNLECLFDIGYKAGQSFREARDNARLFT